jgi:hypothetical protein
MILPGDSKALHSFATVIKGARYIDNSIVGCRPWGTVHIASLQDPAEYLGNGLTLLVRPDRAPAMAAGGF